MARPPEVIPLRPTLSHFVRLAVLALVASPAAAQTVHFLETPGDLRRTPGQVLELALARVEDGRRSAAAFPPDERRARLLVRADGTQENLEHAPLAADGGLFRARIPLPHADANLIGLELLPRTESVARATWQRFAEEKLGARAAAGLPAELRVRRVETLELLVRVLAPGDEARPSATAHSKSGLAFELRPLMDPTCLPPGSDLPLKVYAPEGEGEGLRISARNLPSGAVMHLETRAGGIADLPISHPGIWTVEVHRLAPVASDAGADLELHSSTLVFETPQGDVVREGGK